MIEDRKLKVDLIVATMMHGLHSARFFSQEQLQPYLRLLSARRACSCVAEFLGKDANLSLVFDTLEAWYMNQRGAKMKPTDDFCIAIRRALPELMALEDLAEAGVFDRRFMRALELAYDVLHVMRSEAKFVANAKTLHFLFPGVLMPMDRTYTLQYFYSSTTYTPTSRYLEVSQVGIDIMKMDHNWERYLDDGWNTTVPKLIDNAVMHILNRLAELGSPSAYIAELDKAVTAFGYGPSGGVTNLS